VVKVIWHKTASPPQTDDSIVFAMWHQRATGRAHWRHLANTIELVLPSAHQSPQPKRQIDRFSRFCTAHGRKCIYFTIGDPFPQNCPFSWVDRDPIYFMIPWARPSPQSKLHHDPFSYFRTGDCRVSLYYTMGAAFPKNCPFPRGIWTRCKTQYIVTIPRTHLSPQTKRHLYRFSRFFTDDCSVPVSLYFSMGRPFLRQNC